MLVTALVLNTLTSGTAIHFVMVAGLVTAVEFAESGTVTVPHAKHIGLGIIGIAIAGHHLMHLVVNVILVLEDALNVVILQHAIVVKLLTLLIIQASINAAVFKTSS